ncbi:MAG TPA: hypothetical protein VMH36_09845 [Alphaproteobacteria bacterium]|nr:hypothetical protein [Alphaproteobacteria bacterium]
MGDADRNKQRNRVIAQNEEMRRVTGDIRVSTWAILFAVIIVAIVVGSWAWVGL